MLKVNIKNNNMESNRVILTYITKCRMQTYYTLMNSAMNCLNINILKTKEIYLWVRVEKTYQWNQKIPIKYVLVALLS